MDTSFFALVICLCISLIILLLLIIKNNKLKESYKILNEKYLIVVGEKDELKIKYSSIINIDEEVNKRKGVHENIKEKIERELMEHDLRMKELNKQYVDANELYDKIKNELSKLDDELEITSYGLYKPHFDFDTSDKYKIELEKIIELERKCIKDGEAAICPVTWTVNGKKSDGTKMTKHYMKIMLRAFNGECDSTILKTRWNNINSMEERIQKAYDAINKLGETHTTTITQNYFRLKINELRLTYEYEEKKHDEKEEQIRIREQMREELKAIKEIEKARKEAENEENRYEKALLKAREEVKILKGVELENLQTKIANLEIELKKAQEMKERAISMAQITKAGYIYVISNIGSFGENIYKIGMTRRIEPTDRIRELSGASVPFPYDIHAMIYSENAPELEYALHKSFTDKRLNLINYRKEFFNVSLDDIEKYVNDKSINIEFTKLAEARDFRQTKYLRDSNQTQSNESMIQDQFPVNIYNNYDNEDDDMAIEEES